MDKKFKKIWETSFPYQDKRDDDGHAFTVVEFAEEILKSEKGDENIVIPAAILHDIGWSQISAKERMSLFNTMPGSAEDKELRVKHQVEGAKLATVILGNTSYDNNLVNKIIEIISQHDAGNKAPDLNAAIVRDADKLWMFSEKGFQADLNRRKITKTAWSNYLISVVDKLNTQTAKKIARGKLNLYLLHKQ